MVPLFRPRFALAMDKSLKERRMRFTQARKAETGYARQLNKVARAVNDLVKGLWDPVDESSPDAIGDALNDYADLINSWATSVARRMVTEVNARDAKAWRQASSEMGRLLRIELDTAPTGRVMRERLADQVGLITSLPREAAERVHILALENRLQGRRAAEIADEILETGNVTRSRAMTIARTETTRTASELTRARAEHVGSTEFRWRTMRDADVRPSHRRLDSKVYEWAHPPLTDPPDHHALPGGIWNCRCWAEPILPD